MAQNMLFHLKLTKGQVSHLSTRQFLPPLHARITLWFSFQQVTTYLFFAFRGDDAPVLPLATTGLLKTNSAVSLGNSWKGTALVKDAGPDLYVEQSPSASCKVNPLTLGVHLMQLLLLLLPAWPTSINIWTNCEKKPHQTSGLIVQN